MPGDDDDCAPSCEEAYGEGDIAYAAPSDLCQGVCLLYKADEGFWYSNSYFDYFQEVIPPPFQKQCSISFKPSRLRQVQSLEDMEKDED